MKFSSAFEKVCGKSLPVHLHQGDSLPYSEIVKLIQAEFPSSYDQRFAQFHTGDFFDYFPMEPWRRHHGIGSALPDNKDSVSSLLPLLGGLSVSRFRRFLPRPFRQHHPRFSRMLREGGGLAEAVQFLASSPGCPQPLLFTVEAMIKAGVNNATELRDWRDTALESWGLGTNAEALRAAVNGDVAGTAADSPTIKILCNGGLREADLSVCIQEAAFFVDYASKPAAAEEISRFCLSDFTEDSDSGWQSAMAMALDEVSLIPCDTAHSLHFLLPPEIIEHPVEHWPVPQQDGSKEIVGAVYEVSVSPWLQKRAVATTAAWKSKLQLANYPPADCVAELTFGDSFEELTVKLRKKVFMACGSGNVHTARTVINCGIPYAVWSRPGCPGPSLIERDRGDWKAAVLEHRAEHDAGHGLQSTVLLWDDPSTGPPEGAPPPPISRTGAVLRPPQYAA